MDGSRQSWAWPAKSREVRCIGRLVCECLGQSASVAVWVCGRSILGRYAPAPCRGDLSLLGKIDAWKKTRRNLFNVACSRRYTDYKHC